MASAVDAWPRLLPHYRWVTVLEGGPTERLVEMAAHRDGFPVRWTARQRLEPHQHRIHFTHVRGISRGMDVTWFLEADGPLVHLEQLRDSVLRPPVVEHEADDLPLLEREPVHRLVEPDPPVGLGDRIGDGGIPRS